MIPKLVCPKCKNESAADASFCGVCYEVLKKKPADALPSGGHVPEQAATPTPFPAAPSWLLFDPKDLKLAALVALVPALFFAAQFKDALPITEGWMRFRMLVLLGYVNLAFHEAGHVFAGLFFEQWGVALAGSLFQTLVPIACGVHFFLKGSRAGVLFCLFWTGHNLVDWSFYCADAKLQALILLGGDSGQEGGFHDWAYVLGALKKTHRAQEYGRTVFFLGHWLIAAALTLALKPKLAELAGKAGVRR